MFVFSRNLWKPCFEKLLTNLVGFFEDFVHKPCRVLRILFFENLLNKVWKPWWVLLKICKNFENLLGFLEKKIYEFSENLIGFFWKLFFDFQEKKKLCQTLEPEMLDNECKRLLRRALCDVGDFLVDPCEMWDSSADLVIWTWSCYWMLRDFCLIPTKMKIFLYQAC